MKKDVDKTLNNVTALAFDLFGTVLDLEASVQNHSAIFLEQNLPTVTPAAFWDKVRVRQRLEQYQDTIMCLGHSGYLETVRRAFLYTARQLGSEPTLKQTADWMDAWQQLSPFPDVSDALPRLGRKYKMIALSNGNAQYLAHLVQHRIRYDFELIFSIDTVGVFKPHPAVYRRAAIDARVGLHKILMVSSNSFDVMGARACGMPGAFINRYDLPYEDTPLLPNLEVKDLGKLAYAIT